MTKVEFKWWWDEQWRKKFKLNLFSNDEFLWNSKLNIKCVNWRRSKIIRCQFFVWILFVNWWNSFHTPFGHFSALNNLFKSLMATFCFLFYSRTFASYYFIIKNIDRHSKIDFMQQQLNYLKFQFSIVIVAEISFTLIKPHNYHDS